MNGKKKKVIVFMLLVVILLSIVLWYFLPIKKNITTVLCSMDGEQIEVTFDVSWHRYLASPTKLKGTITINGIVYQSLHNSDSSVEPKEILDNLGQKIKNEQPTQWFVGIQNESSDSYDYVLLTHADRNLDTICMILVQEGDSTTYYGRAETKEDASKIASTLVE